ELPARRRPRAVVARGPRLYLLAIPSRTRHGNATRSIRFCRRRVRVRPMGRAPARPPVCATEGFVCPGSCARRSSLASGEDSRRTRTAVDERRAAGAGRKICRGIGACTNWEGMAAERLYRQLWRFGHAAGEKIYRTMAGGALVATSRTIPGTRPGASYHADALW